MLTNKKNIIFLIVKIVIISLIIFLFNKYVFGIYIVKSIDYKSININPHDFLIYYKLENDYQNNDIVFYNNTIYRVVGTNGQVINNKGNRIYIDNDISFESVEYNYEYPYTIKENELFLINNINDSKNFGLIDKNNISGKLVFRLQIRDF